MERKIWLILPLLFILVFLSQSLPPVSSALEFPAIYVDPDIKVDPNLDPTDSYTISIRTNYTGVDIWGYEFTLTYNPLVLQGVSADNVGLITNATHPTTNITGTFDNNAGKLNLTGAYFMVEVDELGNIVKPVNVTSGPGLLANVTFNVVGRGDTPITLGVETVLYGWSDSGTGDQYKIIDARYQPLNIGHGYFRNTVYVPVHDGVALSGTVNTTWVYKGGAVSINASVKNEGNVNETFDCSIKWGPIAVIYSTTVTVANGTTHLISVIWDTEGFFPGTHNVTLVVGDLWGETDVSDNEKVIGQVHVKQPPTPQIVTATVDISPDALNLKSKGQWITAYIQLPEGYNAENIDATTILLNDTIQPVLDPKYEFVTNSSEYLVDHDGDEILERMVKFDKAEVMALLSVGEATLTITGEVNDTSFEGSDSIRVVLPPIGCGGCRHSRR